MLIKSFLPCKKGLQLIQILINIRVRVGWEVRVKLVYLLLIQVWVVYGNSIRLVLLKPTSFLSIVLTRNLVNIHALLVEWFSLLPRSDRVELFLFTLRFTLRWINKQNILFPLLLCLWRIRICFTLIYLKDSSAFWITSKRMNGNLLVTLFELFVHFKFLTLWSWGDVRYELDDFICLVLKVSRVTFRKCLYAVRLATNWAHFLKLCTLNFVIFKHFPSKIVTVLSQKRVRRNYCRGFRPCLNRVSWWF